MTPMTADSVSVAPAPTGLTERALGPDLARGTMLLFIALANSHYFLVGQRYVGGFPVDGSVVDDSPVWFIVFTPFLLGLADQGAGGIR